MYELYVLITYGWSMFTRFPSAWSSFCRSKWENPMTIGCQCYYAVVILSYNNYRWFCIQPVVKWATFLFLELVNWWQRQSSIMLARTVPVAGVWLNYWQIHHLLHHCLHHCSSDESEDQSTYMPLWNHCPIQHCQNLMNFIPFILQHPRQIKIAKFIAKLKNRLFVVLTVS